MDMPTKEEFATGLKRVREELVEILDEPDGKRMKAVTKKLKAVIPGITLNCTSAEKSVIIDSGPPSIGVAPEDISMDQPIDPWRYVRPYQTEQNTTTEDPVPVDHPALPTAEELVASIQENVLTFEEMYNIMSKDGDADPDSTSNPGDETEPIVVD